ncbi:DUF4145 domain-containing protein [Aliiroseovarius marinus]|uniref:DUF4145 domain-containing protein n=1 Tax=Aliiroseovarius marinus TaxID=2500159 RepID=UPI003D7CCA63
MYYHALKCGNCNHLVDFDFRRVGDFTPRTPEQIKELSETNRPRRDLGISVRTLEDKDIVQGFAQSQCPRCYHPTLIVYECTRLAHKALSEMADEEDKGFIIGGPSRITIKAIYPTPETAEQNPFWPETLRQQFADAQDILAEGRSPSIVLATCRTVLELALKELDPQDLKSPLFNRIEKLHSSGRITTPIKDWAHDVRLDGNNATHDGTGDRAAAAEYVEFLKMFLNMTFSLPARIEEKRNQQSKSP